MSLFNRSKTGQVPDQPAYLTAAPTPNGADERVKRALDAEDFDYKISEQGNFRVVLRFSDEDRTQLTIINSKTRTFRGKEWRKVWSEAFDVTGRLSCDQAIELLADSDCHVFGAWCINERDGKTSVYYQVSVPADASPTELHHAISLVSSIADDMEKDILGTDDN